MGGNGGKKAKRPKEQSLAYPHAIGDCNLYVRVEVRDDAAQLLDAYERTYVHSRKDAKQQFDAIKAALGYKKEVRQEPQEP